MLSHWRHSGFQVFCGERIFPRDEAAMETLTRHIIRASFSQERMQYLPGQSKVVYRVKDGTEERVFDAPEWLTAMRESQGTLLTFLIFAKLDYAETAANRSHWAIIPCNCQRD